MAERNYNIALTATDGFSGAFRKLTSAIGGVEGAASRLRGVMGGLGLTLSAGLFANAISGIVKAAAQLDDLSEKTGASVESLSKFAGVARITGQDLNSVESALGKLSKSLVEAQAGGSQAAKAFAAFGINIRDTQGNLRTSGDVMDELSRKQQGFADGAGKAAATMELLGKSGAEIIPFMNDYVRLSDEVAVTTADEAKAAEDLNIQIGLLKEGFDKLLRDAILPLLPQMREVIRSFEGLATAIANLAPSGKGPLEGLLASIKETNVQTIGEIAYLKQAWENFAAWWKSNSVMDMLGRLGGMPAKQVQMIPPSAARDAAILAERNRELVAVTRELPPLMEATASKTEKAALAYRKADDDAKYVNTHLDEMLRIGKELGEELNESKKFWDDLSKAQEAAGKIAQKHDEILQKEVDTLAEQLAALKAEGQEIGLTQKALNALVLARQDSNIARLEENILLNKGLVGQEAEVAVLEQQLQLRKMIRDETANNQGRQAMVDQANEAKRTWTDLFNNVTDAAADFFEDFLHNGSKAFKNLWENFKNWALSALARVAAQQVVVSIAGLFGGAAGSVASSFGGGSSLFSGAGSLFTGGGEGLLSGVGAGLSAISAGFATFAGNTALAFGATAELSLAMAGLAGTIGMAVPIIGALLAIAYAVGAFDRGGPKAEGSGSSSVDLLTGAVGPGGGQGRLFTGTGADAAYQDLSDVIADGYLQAARALGLRAGSASFSIGGALDPEGTAGGLISAQAYINGQNVYNAADIDTGRDEADFKERLALEAKRALFAALQASDLPTYLANLFDGIDAAGATADQIDNIIATAAALKAAVDAVAGLGDQFASMSGEDIAAFLEAMGGVEEFFQRFAYIADNFYTDTQKLEKNTQTLADSFADLGIVVPDTHQAFLDLLNSLDLTTEEGRAMYEAISALAPLFVAVNGTAQQAADALAAAAAALDDVVVAATNIIDLGSIASAVETEFSRIMERIAGAVSGSSGDFGDRLALQIRLTTSEIARVTASLALAIPGQAEWQGMQDLLARLRNANASATTELAAFTILAAQYDAGRAGQLVELQRWYGEQQRLFAGNADALAALRDLFNDRWKEIIDSVAAGVDGTLAELQRLRDSLNEYLKGLSLRSDLSPLSPSARLAEAQRQYQELLTRAQGGDVDALRQIQGAADAYLRLAREMFASGGSYSSIWQQVVDALGALANPPRTGGVEPNPTALIADALPVGSPMASQADVERMALAVIAAIRDGSREQATATVRGAERTADAARALK